MSRRRAAPLRSLVRPSEPLARAAHAHSWELLAAWLGPCWPSERQLILRMECKATVQQPRSRELML